MSNAISSNFSFTAMKRPDPTQMANKLFSKLDTKNQGYLEKSDLQTALNSVSGDSSNVDALFAQLDGNSDGKVTKDEMSDTLKKLADELDSQFNQMRTQNGMAAAGGMPPPPPPGGGQNGAGFTKDELSSQLEEIGSSDSQRSNLISKVVNNFEAADTDQDGKVSFMEAMAYDQKESSSTSSASTDSTASGTKQAETSELKLMQQILQLMQAYGAQDNAQQNTLSKLLTTTA